MKISEKLNFWPSNLESMDLGKNSLHELTQTRDLIYGDSM